MKNFCVYILNLSNKQQYVGFTENITSRLKEHNKGGCFTTKKYRPVKLAWCCYFTNKSKVLKFEKYLKSGSGTEFRRRHFWFRKLLKCCLLSVINKGRGEEGQLQKLFFLFLALNIMFIKLNHYIISGYKSIDK